MKDFLFFWLVCMVVYAERDRLQSESVSERLRSGEKGLLDMEGDQMLFCL